MFTAAQYTGNHPSVRPQAHSGSRREQGWKPSPTGNSPKSKFLEGAPLLALSTPKMHWKPTQQQQGSGGVRDRVTISVSSAEGDLVMEQTRTCGRRWVSPSHTNGGSVHPLRGTAMAVKTQRWKEKQKKYIERDRQRWR